MDICEVCGFDRDALAASQVIPRVTDGVAAVIEVIAAKAPGHAQRPAPRVWSVLEYAAHIRDVLLHDRHTITHAIAEDTPVRQRMFSDLRVDLGMYAPESAAEIRQGLDVAGRLYTNSYRVLSPQQLKRTAICFGEPRSLRWLGAQAVHEVEHHLADIRAQL